MVNDAQFIDVKDNLTLELRRGVLILVALNQLHEEQYGYLLKKSLDKQGFEINEGTLYPLLSRLEEQGLLQSEWRIGKGRPRRYYLLSPFGKEILKALKSEWQLLGKITNRLLETGG